MANDTISDRLILKHAGQYDKEMIQRLRLSELGIKTMASLNRCVNLQDLCLAFNDISIIQSLEGLSNLRKLDLSFNNCLVRREASSFSKLELRLAIASIYLTI